MITDVKKRFDRALVEKFKTLPDVLKFLIDHPRKKYCLDNLCAEIIRCEKGVINFNAADYRDVIKSVAGMFALQALKKAEEDSLSSIEKIRRQSENDRFENAKELILELEKEGAIKVSKDLF